MAVPAGPFKLAPVETPDAATAFVPALEKVTKVARNIGVATALARVADQAPHETEVAVIAAVLLGQTEVARGANNGPRPATAVTGSGPRRVGPTPSVPVIQAVLPEPRRTATVAVVVTGGSNAAAEI